MTVFPRWFRLPVPSKLPLTRTLLYRTLFQSLLFNVSSITAALYSIMVTLIKVPSPDPFPEWNLPPLPQSWDNGPCYCREQGPTVSRLLAYSPGLIALTLWGTVLLGKALALGGPRWTQISLLCLRQASAQGPMVKQWHLVTSAFSNAERKYNMNCYDLSRPAVI